MCGYVWQNMADVVLALASCDDADANADANAHVHAHPHAHAHVHVTCQRAVQQYGNCHLYDQRLHSHHKPRDQT